MIPELSRGFRLRAAYTLCVVEVESSRRKLFGEEEA
jgi:hypothetical protein